MNPDRLAKHGLENSNFPCTIIGDVCINPTATIHSTAVVRVNCKRVQKSWYIFMTMHSETCKLAMNQMKKEDLQNEFFICQLCFL